MPDLPSGSAFAETARQCGLTTSQKHAKTKTTQELCVEYVGSICVDLVRFSLREPQYIYIYIAICFWLPFILSQSDYRLGGPCGFGELILVTPPTYNSPTYNSLLSIHLGPTASLGPGPFGPGLLGPGMRLLTS